MSKSNDSGFTRGLFLGAAIGGAIGAITALLLAPKSGAELRRDIAAKSSELYDKANDYLQDIESSVGSAVNISMNEGKARAQTIISSAKQQAEEILSSAEKVLQDARSKASVVKETVGEKIEHIREAAKAGKEAFKNELASGEEG